MPKFNEDTRVKIPATLQLLRIGYTYQSMSTAEIDFNTKIFRNRFKPAIEAINGRKFSDAEITNLIQEIHTLMRNNDLGRTLYLRITDMTQDVVLIDFDNPENNDFAVVDELPFTIEKNTEEGSFRPDVNILINGMPLAFLEVKKPNNDGGIQAEFKRMINKRLETPEYRKYFNLLQFISFSNNMEYEDDDNVDVSIVKAGSFYTTPNGDKTSFSFFREDDKGYHKDYPYETLDDDFCRDVIKDLGYDPDEYDTAEFKVNNDPFTPCNRFITSMYDKERFLFILRYGLLYIKGATPEKHIMRYPQFFATRNILQRLENGEKRGIVWHTQGSGKTELAAYASRIIRDYYAKKNVVTRSFFIVDRLDLLRQDNGVYSSLYFKTTNCTSKADFSREVNVTLPKSKLQENIGEMVIVNIQKFETAIPKAKNEYDTNVQRIFFIDEAHRSYKKNGEYFKNLILCDPDAIFIALTGTPLLGKKERSNLKFGDYIHKYFYDKSIADGYTLRIKKEKVDTVVKKEIKENLKLEEPDVSKADVYESDPYINGLCKYIDKDFRNFRVINADDTIGGMIVCKSNPQAKMVHEWFKKNSKLSTGLVISDGDPKQDEANKNNQLDFRDKGVPDILVVHFMLTTGYDVRRLKKMYLLRGPKAQNLLQTISRVNRPYKSPSGKIYNYGYITDFVDIEEEYDRTLNDYLKELEADMNDPDDDSQGSLSGLLVDVETIKGKYDNYTKELADILETEDLETWSKKLTMFNKEILLKIKRLLNGLKDCYVELMLSNAMDDAAKIDIELIKKKLKSTQERINFVNIKEEPVRMIDLISSDEIVEIFYEFLLVSISVIDLSKFDPDSDAYKEFNDNIRKLQDEISKNRNKGDIRIVSLDQMLKKLFASMNITDMDDLDGVNEELRKIIEEAIRINQENERLAAIYDGNFALVKTYQDAVMNRPELDNKDIEDAVRIIYSQINDILDADALAVQGRQGFIDETKKKVTKMLLKAGYYKKLNLKEWLDNLLSEMYTNLQNYR